MNDGGRRLRPSLAAALSRLPPGCRIAAAVSGGPDSVALAVLAAEHARQAGFDFRIFHVHHGLYAQADAWTGQVRELAAVLGVPCEVAHVTVDTDNGKGLEASAREARYAALAAMAGKTAVAHVLLAHHLDDQAETVLIRLLRGAGPDGMGAMSTQTRRDGIEYLRPWLAIPRSVIIGFIGAWCERNGLAPVADPSNLDPAYARGTLRADILPAVARAWPGYRQTLARYAELAQESADLLQQIADADLQGLVRDQPPFTDCLDVAAWAALPPARQTLALRGWLGRHGVAMPSRARLTDLQRQLTQTGHDTRLTWRHGAASVRRYRGWAVLDRASVLPVAKPSVGPMDVVWTGQDSVHIEAYAGTLTFAFAASGIAPDWLREAPLRVGGRSGGERLRLRSDAPARSLKNLYQEAGVPAWRRAELPLLYRADTLVWAAGLGADAAVPSASPGVVLTWKADRDDATLGR